MTLALWALLALQEPSGDAPPDPMKAGSQAPKDDALKQIWEFLTHPFRDNGRRFDLYPYAGDGPYFLTSRGSTKMYAGMLEQNFGRIAHDVTSWATEAMVNWSAGCDARIDSLVFQVIDDRHAEWTKLHHVHLDIGTFSDPSPVDYTLGFGFGALDEEGSNPLGPSVRAAVRGFPAKPISFRLDAVVTWFKDETVADLRAEIGTHVHRLAMTLGVRGLVRSEGDDWIGPTIGMAIYF